MKIAMLLLAVADMSDRGSIQTVWEQGDSHGRFDQWLVTVKYRGISHTVVGKVVDRLADRHTAMMVALDCAAEWLRVEHSRAPLEEEPAHEDATDVPADLGV